MFYPLLYLRPMEQRKNQRGRPSVLTEAKIANAKHLFGMGYSDGEIIRNLEISPSTFYRAKPNWIQKKIRIGIHDFLGTVRRSYFMPNLNVPRAYDLEFAKAFCRELGYSAQFIFTPFSNLVSGVADGNFDLALGLLADSAERRKSVAFSDSYLISNYRQGCLAVRRGIRLQVWDTQSWRGLRIAVMKESMHDSYLSKTPGVILRRYQSVDSCFTAFREKWVDGVFLTELDFLPPRSLPTSLAIQPGQVDFGIRTCVAFHQENHSMAEQIDTFLRKSHRNGFIENASNQFGLVSVS
jgi:L-cystine transport system substrate-binding protein